MNSFIVWLAFFAFVYLAAELASARRQIRWLSYRAFVKDIALSVLSSEFMNEKKLFAIYQSHGGANHQQFHEFYLQALGQHHQFLQDCLRPGPRFRQLLEVQEGFAKARLIIELSALAGHNLSLLPRAHGDDPFKMEGEASIAIEEALRIIQIH